MISSILEFIFEIFSFIYFKYLLIAFSIVLIISIIIRASLSVGSDSRKTIQTLEKFEEIITTSSAFYSDLGRMPSNLEDVIGGRPLRKNWQTDAWHQPIRFGLIGNVITLQSNGPDQLFNTEDDIIIERAIELPTNP